MNKEDLRFSLWLSAVFMLLTCVMAWHHELWIDEAYHYLLPATSSSVPDILRHARTSGHPILWSIVLYSYKFLAPGIFSMQVLHCFLATVCIGIIACYAPFSRLQKTAIAFGYFFAYEYSVIAKNYILGFLLLFITVVLLQKNKKLWLMALILGLAANVHLFTLFVAVFLFWYIDAERKPGSSSRERAVAWLLFTALCAIAVFQIIPPAQIIRDYDAYDTSALLSQKRFARSLGSVAKGLLNIPDLRGPYSWNSNLLANAWPAHFLIISCGVILAVVLYLRNHARLLLLFFGPALLIMCFVHLAPLSVGTRYWGYYYVLLILCTWLLRARSEQAIRGNLFFSALLACQVVVAVPVLLRDVQHPFSNASRTASFLERNALQGPPLFVEKLSLGPALSAYTGKPVYYPSNKTFETFSFQIHHKTYTPYLFVQESLTDLAAMQRDTCILVFQNKPGAGFADAFSNSCSVKEIWSADDAILPSENYFLYLLVRRKT